MEWPVVAALAAVTGAGIGFVGFWMTLSDRITKADARSRSAEQTAAKAERATEECKVQLAAAMAQFSLYREQVAREYIHRDAMREIEDRLTVAIERLGDRLDRFFERQNKP